MSVQPKTIDEVLAGIACKCESKDDQGACCLRVDPHWLRQAIASVVLGAIERLPIEKDEFGSDDEGEEYNLDTATAYDAKGFNSALIDCRTSIEQYAKQIAG